MIKNNFHAVITYSAGEFTRLKEALEKEIIKKPFLKTDHANEQWYRQAIKQFKTKQTPKRVAEKAKYKKKKLSKKKNTGW